VNEPPVSEATQLSLRLARFVTEGTLIASVPAIGYLTTYLYEAEFANMYHIPVSLISIGTASVIRNTLVAAAILWWGIGYSLKISWKLSGDTDASVPPLWLPLLLLMVPVCLFWMIWWPLVAVAAVGTFEFFLNWYAKRRPGGKRLFVATDPQTGKLVMLLPTLLWCYVVARGVGYQDAVAAAEFYVRPGNPELVILRFYDKHAIAAPFDRQRKRVKPEIRILPIENLAENLKRERVGPLAPE
jgi:hypothetical protein